MSNLDKFFDLLDPSPTQQRDIAYIKYLKTDHWKRVKKAMRLIYGNRCQLCRSNHKVNIHHNNYDCLWFETIADVIIICEECHSIFHERIE